MATRHPRRRFYLITLAAAVACTSDPVAVCACTPPFDTALVYGRVTDAAGQPVQGATVTAEHRTPGCAEHVVRLATATTLADGTYGTTLYTYRDEPVPADCVRAYADPPAGSRLLVSDTVPFYVELLPAERMDSVRVDLVMRAR